MDAAVVELAGFKLKPGVTEDELVAASARLEEEFLLPSPGYLGRALTRRPDGGWMDVVLWTSEDAAKAIMPRVPICAQFWMPFLSGNIEHMNFAIRI